MMTSNYETIGDKENMANKTHGKCVCEACNCGRHHCPDPIKHGEYNSSYASAYPGHEGYKPEGKYSIIHKNFILPTDKFSGESSYVGDFNQRGAISKTEKFIPKGQLSLSKDPFKANTSYIDDYLNKGVAQRASPVPQAKNQILPEGKFQSGSNYHENFIGSVSKRPEQFRPVGQLKTGDGIFNGTSSYNQDFENRGVAVRAERAPLPQNKIMPEGRFQGNSNYTDAFIPSKGQKLQQFRPQGQIQVGGQFEGASSYGADYSSRGPGARAQKAPLPKNYIMPEGRFDGNSEYHQTFIPGSYEKQQQFRRQGELKVGGEVFTGQSNYIENYLNKGVAVKAEKVVHPKNQILPEGRFEGDSENHANFLNSKSEKIQQFRPQGQLKVGDGIFDGRSSYGADYENRGVAQRSERVPLPKNQVMPEGMFEGNSAYTADFKNSIATKNPQFRPVGELKVGEGKFEGGTSYTNDYLNKGSGIKAERVPLPRNQIMPQGRFEGGSNYTQNFIKGQIQKNPQFRPVEQIKTGGKFEGQSTYGQNYTQSEKVIKNYCPCETLQAPRTKVAQKQHVRWNELTRRWE